ncbi:MAG: hypothetical protein K2X91_13990, partial [Thermoleophilia bacterium]|nr:hypothetical protein [Thermoleophilia bacterium]
RRGRTPPAAGRRLPSARPHTGRRATMSGTYTLGRLLQMVGLFILPFAIASQLMDKVGLGQSMLIAAGGMVVFYVGVALQNKGR